MTPFAIVPLPQPTDVEVALSGAPPPLVRVVRALLGAGRLDETYVLIVVAASGLEAVRAGLAEAGLLDVGVLGDTGGTRRSCISVAFEYLGREAMSPSHVLIHDHRHPLVPAAVIDRVLVALRDGAAVVLPVLPMTDTVKSVDADGSVIGTIDRATLTSVQYPRGYSTSVLADLIAASGDDVDGLSEALSVGVPITTVDGDGDGFRLALPADDALLEAIIASR